MLHQAISAGTETRPHDRAERQITVLLYAGVSHGGGDGVCRIRNVSATGLAIETSLPLTAGGQAMLTLASGRTLNCTIHWVRDGQAGLSCTENVLNIVQGEGERPVTGMPGPVLPRFYRTGIVTIAVNGRIHRATMDSLSTSDILLAGAPSLQRGSLVSIEIRGLGCFPATVAISQDGDLFARFRTAIPFRLFDGWLARHPG